MAGDPTRGTLSNANSGGGSKTFDGSGGSFAAVTIAGNTSTTVKTFAGGPNGGAIIQLDMETSSLGSAPETFVWGIYDNSTGAALGSLGYIKMYTYVHTHTFTTGAGSSHDHGGATGPYAFHSAGDVDSVISHTHTITAENTHTHTGTTDSNSPINYQGCHGISVIFSGVNLDGKTVAVKVTNASANTFVAYGFVSVSGMDFHTHTVENNPARGTIGATSTALPAGTYNVASS
jgi:hypothetical protein